MEGSRKKITTFYNQHLQQSISKQITHQTLKQVGYASRKPNWVPLLSTEIRTNPPPPKKTNKHNNQLENNAWSGESKNLL